LHEKAAPEARRIDQLAKCHKARLAYNRFLKPADPNPAAGPGAELRGEVVILAVYYPGSLEIVRELGDWLAGKVVVDIANPLNQTFDGLATAPCTSAAGGSRDHAAVAARVELPECLEAHQLGSSRRPAGASA